MPLLKERERASLREQFEAMTAPVRLVFFTQALGCETCPLTERILDEIAELSDKLQVVKYNFALDRDAVARFGIARIPAIAVLRLEPAAAGLDGTEPREIDYGIRFYGVPSGYEFMALIGAILDVSSGDSHLSPESRALVAKITDPTHIQVFTTPT